MKTDLGYKLSPWGLLAIALAVALSMTMGCSAKFFACTTKASYIPETGAFVYDSCKDQQSFHAKLPNGAEVSTSASTPEAAIAAATNALAAMMKTVNDLMQQLAPLLKTGAAVASKGAITP